MVVELKRAAEFIPTLVLTFEYRSMVVSIEIVAKTLRLFDYKNGNQGRSGDNNQLTVDFLQYSVQHVFTVLVSTMLQTQTAEQLSKSKLDQQQVKEIQPPSFFPN